MKDNKKLEEFLDTKVGELGKSTLKDLSRKERK